MPKKKTKQDVIAEFVSVHGDEYSYDNVEYINTMTKVEIICPKHGSFFQIPTNHKKGQKCPICKIQTQISRVEDTRLNTEQFIQNSKVTHGTEYDYSQTEYVNQKTKVQIVCKTHGAFWQRPGNHTQGQGCPKCRRSKGEVAVKRALECLGVEFIEQHRFDDCRNKRPLPYDFYIPEHGLLIEFDGTQHKRQAPFQTKHDFARLQQHDNIKTKYATDNGYTLLRLNPNHIKNMDKILQEEMYG